MGIRKVDIKLIGAAKDGNLSRVKWLIQTRGANINAARGEPLRMAKIHDHKEVADWLVSQGAVDPSYYHSHGLDLSIEDTKLASTQLQLERICADYEMASPPRLTRPIRKDHNKCPCDCVLL